MTESALINFTAFTVYFEWFTKKLSVRIIQKLLDSTKTCSMIEFIHNFDSFLFSLHSKMSHENSFLLSNHFMSSLKSSENDSSESTILLDFSDQIKTLENSEF